MSFFDDLHQRHGQQQGKSDKNDTYDREDLEPVMIPKTVRLVDNNNVDRHIASFDMIPIQRVPIQNVFIIDLGNIRIVWSV